MECLTHRDVRSPTFATCSKVQRVQGGAAHIPGRVRYTQVSGDMRTPTSCGVVRGAWCVLVRGGVALFAWSRGFLSGGRALDASTGSSPLLTKSGPPNRQYRHESEVVGGQIAMLGGFKSLLPVGWQSEVVGGQIAMLGGFKSLLPRPPKTG